MTDTRKPATAKRKGKSASGNPYSFEISVKGMSLNGMELPDYLVQGTLDSMADKIAADIEAGKVSP